MPGDGPFVWIRDQSAPGGFWHAPEGGMCVNAFLFVRRGRDILLGKYADHPAWDELAGLRLASANLAMSKPGPVTNAAMPARPSMPGIATP